MLDINQRLRDTTTFDELLSAIRDDTDLRQALVRTLIEEFPEDVVSHISVSVGRDQAAPVRFDLGRFRAGS